MSVVHTAKHGKDWTQNELISYGISIQEQESDDFFGVPLPVVTPDLSSFTRSATVGETPPSDQETYQLLRYLEIAQRGHEGHKGARDNLMQRLLERLGYTFTRRIILHDLSLPFVIGGETRTAELSQVLLDENGWIFIIIQSDMGDGTDPEAQLIASAVAAFQQNNLLRTRELHMPPLEVSIFPAIALYGTLPIFYRIAVSVILSEGVITGSHPGIQTTVERHTPRLPPGLHLRDGMGPVASRRVIVEYLQAFRRFV